jgi:hypothetical protein
MSSVFLSTPILARKHQLHDAEMLLPAAVAALADPFVGGCLGTHAR